MIAPNASGTNPELEDRIKRVRDDIASAAHGSGRDAAAITLVAVSKSVDRAAVDAAYAAGLRHFGENRVQDSIVKFTTSLPPDTQLHLIGQLQSNKAKPAIRLFDIIESVDRQSLIAALQSAAANLDTTVRILLQVNVARESQKSGCSPDDAVSLIESILDSPNLVLRGLMTIAPLVDDPEEVRPVFRGLCDLRECLQSRFPETELSFLSMGMSNDFPVAIEEGATHIRVGRALFHG